MMAKWPLLLAAVALGPLSGGEAYVASGVRRSAFRPSAAQAPAASMMASPAPAPATKTKTRTVTKPGAASPAKPQAAQKAKTAKPELVTQDAHVPMWKVLLLADDEYEEDPVCGAICEVIPDIGIDEVRQKYKEAMATGDSVLTIVNQEHAEAYVSQFHRSMPMIFADAQPE